MSDVIVYQHKLAEEDNNAGESPNNNGSSPGRDIQNSETLNVIENRDENQAANSSHLRKEAEEVILKEDLNDVREQLRVAQSEVNNLKNLQQDIIEVCINKDPTLSGPIQDKIEESKKKKKKAFKFGNAKGKLPKNPEENGEQTHVSIKLVILINS